jgi:hypothetical protein
MACNPTNDFIQFIAGGSLFGGGIFLLANQVMASSALTYRGGGWGRYVVALGQRGVAGDERRIQSTATDFLSVGSVGY